MDGESLKEGLEGLSKIDGISDVLFSAMYWVAVVFIILFVGYICVSINVFIRNKKNGISRKDRDDFLD
ncbi:MAG: hypothetical protein PUG10_06785 [Lachnospiraceae bacterium]|nr:hypothetical protein [Lachnospiraceae bacterium]